jgi:hypothetical protein
MDSEMAERFADRLAPDTFRNDEPWGVALVRAGRPVDWGTAMPDEQAAIPEGIAERLLALGRAYGLHQLSTLDGARQNRLNAPQAANLASEVEFLVRVDDSALREHVKPLLEFAIRCGRSKDTEFLLEAP